jgi:hypothetical protein
MPSPLSEEGEGGGDWVAQGIDIKASDELRASVLNKRSFVQQILSTRPGSARVLCGYGSHARLSGEGSGQSRRGAQAVAP